MFSEGWLGETGRVYVRACVIRNDRMRQPSYDASEDNIDLDLAQRALGCNILLFSSRSLSRESSRSFSFSSEYTVPPFLLLSLSLESTLQGCFLQSSFTPIPAAHSRFNKSNVNLVFFSFSGYYEFSKINVMFF